MINIVEKDNAVVFTVRVIPRSSRSEIIGEHNGALKIKINSPPVDGAANVALIELLAKEFAVSKSQIEILSGHSSKTKRVKVFGAGKSVLLFFKRIKG